MFINIFFSTKNEIYKMNAKYNPDNVLKKRTNLSKDIGGNHLEENSQLIPYKKESWIQKLFKKIKDAFKK